MRNKMLSRMIIPVYLFCLMFSLSVGPAAAAEEEPFLWPLKGFPVKLTGVMYDKRNDHAHAGIDLSLFGKSGKTPVVAVREGVLMRLRDSRFGYGKTVYVRHPDKHVTVYAHLDRFSPRLQAIADGLRRRTGLKRLDYYYEEYELNVPIARGEVLGYGGKSGTNTPHLHFELRWDDVVNLNPLTNGFAVEDVVPPAIRRLILVPVDPDATVNDRAEPLILEASQLPAEAVAVRGRVGLAVEAEDLHQPKGSRFSPYRLTLLVDGRPWFETRYERYSYLDQRAYLAQFDREPTGRGVFHRVYNPYPADLPFFSAPDAGTFDALPPGRHDLTLIVADAAGLESRLHLAVFVAENPWAGRRPWPRGAGSFLLGDGRSATAEDGGFSVETPAGACFEPFSCSIAPIEPGMSYQVSESPLPLRNAAVLRFRYPDQVQDPDQLGVYRLTDDRPEFLGAEHDPVAGTVAGRSLLFGRIALLRDNRAPVLDDLHPDQRAPLFLSFSVRDDLSGLNRDAVRVLVDSEPALVDFDQRRGEVRVEIFPWPKPGEHEVKIEIADRIGNKNIHRFSRQF